MASRYQNRLDRCRRYHDYEHALVRALPKAIPADRWITRDELMDTLVNHFGIERYTPALLTRRVKDLGYGAMYIKAQGSRHNVLCFKRLPNSIYAPHPISGRVTWLNAEDSLAAHEAPDAPSRKRLPRNRRLNLQLTKLTQDETIEQLSPRVRRMIMEANNE